MQRHSCDANSSVAYIVASVHAPGTAKHELVRSRFANSSVPDAIILPAVNGFNETEVNDPQLEARAACARVGPTPKPTLS